jgi:predicted MPP superfamily phosphohydrolase
MTKKRMRARRIRIWTLFPLIMLGSALFAAGTWSHFSGLSGLGWDLIPILFVACFAPVLVVSFRRRHPVLRALSVFSATALGFLNFAFVAALACWAAAGVAGLFHLPLRGPSLAAVTFGGALLATLYGLANAAWLRVTRVTVQLANLPAAWKNREIALVSDIHIGSIRSHRFVRRVVGRLNRLKPFAVFISGDMFDGTKVDLERVVRPWSDLRAPAGAYFVSGNHDEFGARAPLLAALEGAGLRVLHNEKIEVQGMQVVGVHDREAGAPRLFRDILRRAEIDRGTSSILLAHQPANLEVPEEAGISLQLSGHTHGGQFWPWSFIISRVHGRFAYGLNRLGNLQVFTSSGAGTWGPPLRVGTKSEIVLIRLEAASAG